MIFSKSVSRSSFFFFLFASLKFFPSLLRLRQELTKLIASYTDKITDPVAKATAQSTVYDALLQGLSKGPHLVSHPKAQSEIAFWREREEEARRRIVSTRRQR